jgi:cyclic 2,3-diphosphoglycerate synthetase
MSRVIALIDGEHYPPVVRFALGELAREHEVVAAVFLGGTEKIDLDAGLGAYGVPLVTAPTAAAALSTALSTYAPDAVFDLSDEPVLTSADRFELASIALAAGAEYRGADFTFKPPAARVVTTTPTLAIIGTGKRVGKTAVSAFIARQLKDAGADVAVLAMGRGGPAEPELIFGERVALTTPDLLALAREGVHASSDNYEDAVMSRVTTVGCRRCGGGMAGETFFSNVPEGALLADTLGKELVILEGSGSAIPPVAADATVLVIGAGRGETYVRDYFGPYRLARADLAIIASARPDLPVVATTFRPAPIESVAGKRVFFATTAPAAILPTLSAHLEAEYGCEVVASSANLSNRSLLRADMAAAAGGFDLLLTELKAAAIDVVAAAGEEWGVPTLLCDNVPIAVDGANLAAAIEAVAHAAMARGSARAEGGQ